MSSPDLFANRLNQFLIVAPAPNGRLDRLVEYRSVIFQRNGTELEQGLTRWIFADLPKKTLKDSWGNPYDHQAHSLLAGTFAEGEAFVQQLESQEFVVEDAPTLFVPLQTLDINSEQSSDRLRTDHPRAFALARRDRPSMSSMVTSLRDSMVLGG